jgi:hypothetical protein
VDACDFSLRFHHARHRRFGLSDPASGFISSFDDSVTLTFDRALSITIAALECFLCSLGPRSSPCLVCASPHNPPQPPIASHHSTFMGGGTNCIASCADWCLVAKVPLSLRCAGDGLLRSLLHFLCSVARSLAMCALQQCFISFSTWLVRAVAASYFLHQGLRALMPCTSFSPHIVAPATLERRALELENSNIFRSLGEAGT